MRIKNPVLVQIGSQIRAAREARGYAQDEFARLIGFDRGYYGHVERGTHNISMLNLIKIALGLGLDPGSLLPPLDQLESLAAQGRDVEPTV